MSRYRIEGTKHSTGRRNKLTVSALGIDHARELAEAKGIEVEFCERQEDEHPTDRQTSYAVDLGIDVRGISTIHEMSSAISIKTRQDKLAHWAHVALADDLGIDTWNGIGKREVFELIFRWLCRPGQEERLCAWFAFRVYRHLCGNQSGVGQQTFPSARFDCIGSELAAEPGMLGSIQRAGRDGSPFVWFGSWKTPDGFVHQGNSTKSRAFKRAAELVENLVPHSGAPAIRRESFRFAPTAPKQPAPVRQPAYRASGTTGGVTGSGSFRRMEVAAAALAQARAPNRPTEPHSPVTPTVPKQPVPASQPVYRSPATFAGAGTGSGSFRRMDHVAAALAQPRESLQPIQMPPPPGRANPGYAARTCKRCGYKADAVPDDPTAECKRCGANYAKAEVAIAQEQATIEAVKARVARAREQKKQKPVPAAPTLPWWQRLLALFRRS